MYHESKEVQEMKRLYEDRWRLYNKLSHIGYVPDADMREALEDIMSELSARIVVVSERLMNRKVSYGE